MNGCFRSLVDGSLAGTATAAEVCEELTASFDECTVYRLDLSECPEILRLYDDATVEEARRCATLDCTKRSGCINEAITLTRPKR